MLGIRSSNEGTCTANVYNGCIERKRNQPIGGCIEIKKNYQNKGFEGLDCARYEEKNVQFEVLFIKQRFSISFFFFKNSVKFQKHGSCQLTSTLASIPALGLFVARDQLSVYAITNFADLSEFSRFHFTKVGQAFVRYSIYLTYIHNQAKFPSNCPGIPASQYESDACAPLYRNVMPFCCQKEKT